MAKKKKVSADSVRSKKSDVQKKTNPFEIKFNKQKHTVLGKKITKHEKGMPGVARSKAIKKRKDTLLEEFKTRGKASKFVDRRLGEGDADMSVEDKMLQRFAVERQKHHEKAGLFNLNEDEELTHYGQSLSAIEKFEAPPSDSDDDEDSGKIGAKMVSEEHFGGGMLSKKNEEDSKKSWKERMEDIIAKSKKAKYEKQHEKEKTVAMTEKLDQEWKDVRLLLAGANKPADEDSDQKKADAYDIMVRELKFEAKGNPTDRLKTEEELAKEEKERLEELEADRLRRMKGITEEEEQTKHRSADDLDDGFYKAESVDPFEIQYKDGKMVVDDNDGDNESDDDDDDDDDEEVDDDDEEVEDDDEEVEDDDEEEEEMEEQNLKDTEEADGEDEDSEAEESDDAMEHMSDLESDSEEEDGEEIEEKITPEDFKEQLKAKKEVMEAARKELPYTFKAPDSYEDLVEMLSGHSLENQDRIVERIRKCTHPSLAEGNKEKLQILYGYLLQYCGDCACADPPQLPLVEKLLKHLFALSQMSPLETGSLTLKLITEKQQELQSICERRNGRGRFPGLDTLIILKIISLLFPTSDFWHPVVTPAMLLMSQVLTQCPVTSCQDAAAGLFICSLFLEYVSFSKRFVPEVISFLQGILFLACKQDASSDLSVIPPFKRTGKYTELLVLEKKKKYEDKCVKPVNVVQAWSSEGATYMASDEFRLCLIHQCLMLVWNYAQLYENLPSFYHIFLPIRNTCSCLPKKHYPAVIKDLLHEVLEQLRAQDDKTMEHLIIPQKKPVPLKMFEPKVEEVFEGKKKRSKDREFNDKQRLMHRHKKEMKGAIREIRKDTSVLAKEKLKIIRQRDAEREQKTKDIMNSLASQEGDYKALKRKKDKAF